MAIVMITGCSSGFGLLTAVELAKRGHTVHATMRDLSRSGPLQSALDEAGVKAKLWQLDVTDPASIASAVRATIEDSGQIDALVNNAGAATGAPVEEMALEDMEALFATNVFGSIRTTQAVLPAMRTRRSGHIVNVTSLAAFLSPPFMGAYAATKHAMDALGEALATEVAPFGIHVTNVAPAAYDTPMIAVTDNVMAAIPSDSPYAERWRTATSRHKASMQQNANPADVAVAVADAIEADAPPPRVVVPAAMGFIAEARGTTPPETLRAMVAQSYGLSLDPEA
jgi:NAD(P)-dependent dehydrogenase (short-subunit alcohol dehydrogenase family)